MAATWWLVSYSCTITARQSLGFLGEWETGRREHRAPLSFCHYLKAAAVQVQWINGSLAVGSKWQQQTTKRPLCLSVMPLAVTLRLAKFGKDHYWQEKGDFAASAALATNTFWWCNPLGCSFHMCSCVFSGRSKKSSHKLRQFCTV